MSIQTKTRNPLLYIAAHLPSTLPEKRGAESPYTLTGVLKKIKGKLLDLNYLRGVSWHTLLVPLGSSVLNTDKVVSGNRKTGRI